MGVHVKLWERTCGAGRDEATREPSGAAPVPAEAGFRRALTVRDVATSHKPSRDTSVIFFGSRCRRWCATGHRSGTGVPGEPHRQLRNASGSQRSESSRPERAAGEGFPREARPVSQRHQRSDEAQDDEEPAHDLRRQAGGHEASHHRARPTPQRGAAWTPPQHEQAEDAADGEGDRCAGAELACLACRRGAGRRRRRRRAPRRRAAAARPRSRWCRRRGATGSRRRRTARRCAAGRSRSAAARAR